MIKVTMKIAGEKRDGFSGVRYTNIDRNFPTMKKAMEYTDMVRESCKSGEMIYSNSKVIECEFEMIKF